MSAWRVVTLIFALSATGAMSWFISFGGLAGPPLVALAPFALVWGVMIFTRRLRLAYHLIYAAFGGLLLCFPVFILLNSTVTTDPEELLAIQSWVTKDPIVFLGRLYFLYHSSF